MPASSFQRNALFLGISVAAGIAVAVLVLHFWPAWVRPPSPPPAAVAAGDQNATRPNTANAESDTGVGRVPAIQSADVRDAGSRVAQETSSPGSFAAAVRATAPAVVSVYAQGTERVAVSPLAPLLGTPPPRTQQSLGSGVIVDTQGHIVTNHHVIAGSDKIRVQLADGRVADAKIVGSDPDTDLAVLQIGLPKAPVMALGRSDRVQVGDIVLAIGTPLGLSQTVTHGIVSALGRAGLNVAAYENFIQTDAAINIGNSGGALVNARGELIGINTAVLGKNLGAEGIGVAIPVDLVRGVMQEILQHGRVIRGWIGILPVDVGPEEAARYGLPHAGIAISDLYRNSPAVEIGLARGDMIETVTGQPVHTSQDTLARIASHKPGSKVTLTGMRGTQRFKVDVRVIEAPTQNVQ
ncbi:MAG TPA: trypsin-like peptidase domain-containing protein [Steroidobacteraceae bacterium]|nr:trypsin-like peptidase domain-containing protein [Steroidobacteraceae bacterium]